MAGGGGYLKNVTLHDIGGGEGVCRTPKKGDVIKVQRLIEIIIHENNDGSNI